MINFLYNTIGQFHEYYKQLNNLRSAVYACLNPDFLPPFSDYVLQGVQFIPKSRLLHSSTKWSYSNKNCEISCEKQKIHSEHNANGECAGDIHADNEIICNRS